MESATTVQTKLFPRFMIAVKAMGLCCETPDQPVARSEVYNETWMLRLTLAAIHDYEGNFDCADEMKKAAFEAIRAAVRRRWISEGGLEPAFKHEGTTWTDAILGSVKIKDDNKRGIEVDGDDPGITIVEAKIGSELSPGVTNSPNYNQAARNIACLAQLILKHQSLHDKCRFLVFAPEKGHVGSGFVNKENVDEIIGAQHNASLKDYSEFFSKDVSNNSEQFDGIVRFIREKSCVIFWDEVIKAMKSWENIAELRAFYIECLKENKLEQGNLG